MRESSNQNISTNVIPRIQRASKGKSFKRVDIRPFNGQPFEGEKFEMKDKFPIPPIWWLRYHAQILEGE
ncbi:unnamed protein product [Prunus armeniaca]